MKAIVNGTILLPDAEVRNKALLYDAAIIGIVDEADTRREAVEIIDARGAYVAPGLMDVHIHGYGGDDVSDDDQAGVRRMSERLLENGVTSFLPTTLTVAWDTLKSVCCHMRPLARESQKPEYRGSEILGVHLEGPFVNPERKGAQNEEYILPPDADRVLPFADIVRLITLAPEMPGGYECIRALKQQTDIAISMGHSSAKYDQAMNAIGLGVTRVTHLFNAMSPLHHRDPGVVGAALNSDVYTELIADTFHVNKGIFPMLAKAKGDRLVLITDALRSAGMPDGEYENGGQTFVLKGIECRLKDGTIAGSVLRLNQAVRNYRDFGGVTMAQAVRAASLAPAESIGLADEKGSLTPGKDADITLLDADCNVLKTIVRGVCKYEKDEGKSGFVQIGD
ncbi:MAG: N-acetylglucosamine-6-phosphate deacetylase [Clostridia bacterium]|nr:N-acetylglucosamine-6-phosphate deacetylase [Clostridia bacterium]